MFNNIASIPTGNVPSFLFNLTGITAWNYFSQCLTGTSNTFTANAGIFGKVYFPRVIIPLKTVISNLFKFGIQLLILIIFYCYFLFQGADISPNGNLILFPVYVLMMALLGTWCRNDDLCINNQIQGSNGVVGFATTLLMYISAVPYPLSEVDNKMPDWAWLVKYNPLTQIIEGFRYMILDTGIFTWPGFLYTLGVSIMLFLLGLIIFNRTEKNFIDTV